MKALKRENNTCDPADAGHPHMVLAEELGGERGMREIKKKKNRILAPVAEMHMKGMMSIFPDSCIFPYIEEH